MSSERQRFGDDVGGDKSGRDKALGDIVHIYQDGMNLIAQRLGDLEGVVADLVQGIKDRDTINGERFQSISSAFIQFRTRMDTLQDVQTKQSAAIEACKAWLIGVAIVVALNAGAALVLLVAFARGWL